MSTGRTLYQKIWDEHVVEHREDGVALIYIDRHLIHEVTTPQAFEGLRLNGRKVRRPEATLAVPDHNVPTTERDQPIKDPASAEQVRLLEMNARDYGIEFIPVNDIRQGIVHVIGPEQGLTQPGMTLVCGDSHTSTHGAFGALAFGIGTSEVEHVLATQTLMLKQSRSMRICVDGALGFGVEAKDLALAIIGAIGTNGGTGHVVEYVGEAVRALSMEGRMTLCNMAIEAGARSGLIAPDETTFAYLQGRPRAPEADHRAAAIAYWSGFFSDDNAVFDKEIHIDATKIAPQVTWGTSPEDVVAITGVVPSPEDFADDVKSISVRQTLDYMGLIPGTRLEDVKIDRVFIGSCTNGRIEDLRAAAKVVAGRNVAANIVAALVVPGSGLVKYQAEQEGLDQIFLKAGFEWRDPGCSMCLGMNPDKVGPKERCASTSNRNFVGRQGPLSRTHLVSPVMAAAAAVTGRLCDVRQLMA